MLSGGGGEDGTLTLFPSCIRVGFALPYEKLHLYSLTFCVLLFFRSRCWVKIPLLVSLSLALSRLCDDDDDKNNVSVAVVV